MGAWGGKMRAGVEILRTLTWNLLSNASRGSGNLGQEYICNTRALTGNQLWLGRSWGSRASLTVIFNFPEVRNEKETESGLGRG